MARIGSLNILSSGLTIEDFNAKLGAQTPHAVAIGEGQANPLNWVGPGTAGQVLQSEGPNADPAYATLVAGTGISITNVAGSITITATGASGGFSWTTASGTVTMMANTGYVVNGNTLFTLPASATLGQITEVVGNGASWSIDVSAGTVHLITSHPLTSIASTSSYDALTLVCVDPPNTYVATATQGNITVT